MGDAHHLLRDSSGSGCNATGLTSRLPLLVKGGSILSLLRTSFFLSVQWPASTCTSNVPAAPRITVGNDLGVGDGTRTSPHSILKGQSQSLICGVPTQVTDEQARARGSHVERDARTGGGGSGGVERCEDRNKERGSGREGKRRGPWNWGCWRRWIALHQRPATGGWKRATG